MKIHAVLRECATDLLDTEDHVTVDQVVGCAWRRHGESFAEAQEQMVMVAARTIVRDLLRKMAEDDADNAQGSLFGGLPAAIAVPTPDGTFYVRADKATWPHLLAGRGVRADNVDAARTKLAAYDETLESLRPLMENDHDLSVAEAVRRLNSRAA